MGCGCLLMPLKAVWTFLRWCFTNGWKGLIVLAVAIILAVVIFNVAKGSVTDKVTTPAKTAVDYGIPSIKEAPFIVQTSSRYYFAQQVVQKDGITTITVYWGLSGKKWVKNTGTLVFGKQFGIVTIGKRK